MILARVRQQQGGALNLIGIAAVLVGIGSFAFHATGTFIGEVLDVSAMYLISGLFVIFAAKRLFGWSDARLAWIYTALNAVSIALLISTRHSGIPVFALQLVLAGALELRLFRTTAKGSVNYKPLLGLMACFTLAFIAWILDISGRVCDPDNHIFGGHAFWHVANSGCLWLYYVYQRQFVAPVGET